MTASNTLYVNALEAVHSIGLEAATLHRDNVKLAEGVAAQVKIIRELRDEVSRLQADLDIQSYNVEFLKVQARRTRLKLRSAKRGHKQAREIVKLAVADRDDAKSKLLYSEQTIEKYRVDNRQLDTIVTNRNLEIASLKAALSRSEQGNPLPLTMVTEPLPFKVRRYETPFGTQTMTQVNVQQCATSIMIAPEHIRDVEAHAAVAQEAARRMAIAMEQEILNALRGEHTPVQDARRKLYEKMIALRQQRQTVGADGVIAGRRADIIIADDVTTSPSAEDAQRHPAPAKRPSWMINPDF